MCARDPGYEAVYCDAFVGIFPVENNSLLHLF